MCIALVWSLRGTQLWSLNKITRMAPLIWFTRMRTAYSFQRKKTSFILKSCICKCQRTIYSKQQQGGSQVLRKLKEISHSEMTDNDGLFWLCCPSRGTVVFIELNYTAAIDNSQSWWSCHVKITFLYLQRKCEYSWFWWMGQLKTQLKSFELLCVTNKKKKR